MYTSSVAGHALTPTSRAQHDPGPAVGVRGEHELRVLVKALTEQNERLSRAVLSAHRYVYGRHDTSDLTDLKRVLTSAGYPQPARPVRDDGDE